MNSRHEGERVRFYDSVGRCIRESREAAGLTIKELADQIGTSHTTLGHIEHGTSSCSLYVLACIAEVLDTTLDSLAPVMIAEREDADV